MTLFEKYVQSLPRYALAMLVGILVPLALKTGWTFPRSWLDIFLFYPRMYVVFTTGAAFLLAVVMCYETNRQVNRGKLPSDVVFRPYADSIGMFTTAVVFFPRMLVGAVAHKFFPAKKWPIEYLKVPPQKPRRHYLLALWCCWCLIYFQWSL